MDQLMISLTKGYRQHVEGKLKRSKKQATWKRVVEILKKKDADDHAVFSWTVGEAEMQPARNQQWRRNQQQQRRNQSPYQRRDQQVRFQLKDEKELEVVTAQCHEHAEHAAIVRYCEQNNKDATVVQWPEVQVAGGLDKFGTNPNFQVLALGPKKVFHVLHAQKAAKSRKKRQQNQYSITKANEAPVMQLREWGQSMIVGQEQAQGGGMQQMQQHVAAAQGEGVVQTEHHQQQVKGAAAEMEGLQRGTCSDEQQHQH